MALTNDNAYFHMREDRYRQNVDVEAVAEFAGAPPYVVEAIRGMTAAPGPDGNLVQQSSLVSDDPLFL